MDSSAEPLLLSLKPWPTTPTAAADEDTLPSLVQRINAQRGHFKNVSEEILEAELSADASTANAADEAPASTEDADPAQSKAEVKAQMLNLTDVAQNEAMLALEYISLLVSLQSPEIGHMSMSDVLRQSVPVGCLNFDKVSVRPDVKAQKDDLTVAKVWKMEGVKSAAEALRAAGKRMGEAVEKERKYWEQLMTVRQDGWVITRMSRERSVMGVRYGFSEAAQEFKDRGVSALRMGEDGGVVMDDAGVQARVLRVRVMREAELLGVFVRETKGAGEDVKGQIERARNFIYDEELFFEIMKEARTLVSQGVRTSEDSATIETGDGRRIVVDMISPDADIPSSSSPSDTKLANTISTTLRILLSYAHRQNLKRRSRPPPLLQRTKIVPPPAQLLRPIATYLHHHTFLQHLESTLQHLRELSLAVGLSTSYRIFPLRNIKAAAAINGVESCVETFLGTLETGAAVSLPGGWEVDITMRTRLAHPFFGTVWVVTATGVRGEESKFAAAEDMEAWLKWCFERGLVEEIVGAGRGWGKEAAGNEARKGEKRVRCEVEDGGLVLAVGITGGRDTSWRWAKDGMERGLWEVLDGDSA